MPPELLVWHFRQLQRQHASIADAHLPTAGTGDREPERPESMINLLACTDDLLARAESARPPGSRSTALLVDNRVPTRKQAAELLAKPVSDNPDIILRNT